MPRAVSSSPNTTTQYETRRSQREEETSKAARSLTFFFEGVAFNHDSDSLRTLALLASSQEGPGMPSTGLALLASLAPPPSPSTPPPVLLSGAMPMMCVNVPTDERADDEPPPSPSPSSGGLSPALLAAVASGRNKRTGVKRKRPKAVSWGAPRRVPANHKSSKMKKAKAAPPPRAEGGVYTQPRGRPPHDVDGNKMIWDKEVGGWKSASGAARLVR